ncbi:MAG: MerR family transcriptional regulator [Clostridia bacterium]|nr:MerR family transcriptional regulator [Clostridia bacterium]
MRIHEAAKAVGCTQRAIKFYEEKGLLSGVYRNENGYREYTQSDLRTLHAIQAYRKLGISVSDIKALLVGKNTELLEDILARKKADAAAKQEEIRALEAFLASGDEMQLDEAVDYGSIAQAMREQLPGFFGHYLSRHFAPYLNIRIHTQEQRNAYDRILAYWDNPALKLPLLYRLSAAFSMLMPPISAEQMDDRIKTMLNPDEDTYIRIREQTEKTIRMREKTWIRYSPSEVLKRRMMRSLRNSGYFDIFIPQMKRLSPSYKAYYDAMEALNTRLCNDLNLYYDSDFNLMRKE